MVSQRETSSTLSNEGQPKMLHFIRRGKQIWLKEAEMYCKELAARTNLKTAMQVMNFENQSQNLASRRLEQIPLILHGNPAGRFTE